MALDPRRIVDALLSKTVANGCTPAEAVTARAKAVEIAEKHGIPLEAARPSFHRSSGPSFSEMAMAEMRRRAEEAMMQKMQENLERAFGGSFKFDFQGFEHSAKWQQRRKEAPKAKPASPKQPEFKSVRECAEHWLDPKWKRKHDSKPLTHADVANLVRRSFPDARTSAASVSWYASQMRKAGRL